MFTFPLTPAELFAERRRQFGGWGVPDEAIAAVEARVTDMWADAPGGWTTEWAREARSLEDQGRLLEASLAYGAARFPCLATPARVDAYHHQLDLFAQATATASASATVAGGDTATAGATAGAGETGDVRREVVGVSYRGREREVAVHRYPVEGAGAVLVLTGGVDTWKAEMHRMASAFRQLGEVEVVVFDMPGTGESDVALAPDAEVVYRQVVDAARRPGLPVGVMGVSFGGMWAAKLALLRQVDFAVDLGGPIGAQPPVSRQGRAVALPNGMAGIVAHALQLDALPAPDELPAVLQSFSLAGQGLLGADARPAPLLVVNGADDVYVPRADSTVFEQYPQAEVHLLSDAGHCAAERITEAVALAIGWVGGHRVQGAST